MRRPLFNLEFLHVIREYEYKEIVKNFPIGSEILEIGGGTGYQAKRLQDDGFSIKSIDIPSSNYADDKEFEVVAYDGKNIPFPDNSFDVVFSSNVLEHVADLPHLQNEIKRVLRPNGRCVHVMPSGGWRFWTNIAHYTELIQRIYGLAPRLKPNDFSRHSINDSISVLRLILSTARSYVVVPRHGETGNSISEIWSFSAAHWRSLFKKSHFKIEKVKPLGLFYTGHMVFGARWNTKLRHKISKILGSACIIYIVHPES